jgi:hypothetical protein
MCQHYRQFNKPFTVFAIVNHNDKRVIQPYTITPNEYYEERAKIVVSTILAKQSFCLKTCEDLSINQLMIKAKTIDIKGNTIDFNRFATFSEGETRFAAQSFLLDRAGHHQATTIRFLCGGPIVIGEDHDVYERHIDTKKHKEHTVIRTSVPTKIEADYAHFESLGGADITFVGTQIESPSEVVTGGRVHFKLGTNTYYSYRFDDDSNALWRDQTSSVQQDLTFSVCQFTHPMHIKNASQVIIEKVQKKARKGGFYRSLLLGILDEQEAAGSTSDPAFVQQLRFMSEKTPDKLEYILAKEVHTYQENCVSGPGVGLMAIVAVATAVLTNGLGSSLYASATGTQVGALSSTAVAASNAAMSSLCVQTSMGLMQNGGDPFKTLQTLTSKDTVKNIALSAATAGVCDLATQALGFSGTDLTFADNLQKHLAHASISTGIRAAAGEEIKDPIEAIARSATASAIGQWAAGQIGAAYADPHNPIDPASHKLYHAALGAATGSLMGGTGCVVSGAVGALVAELSTDIMGPSKPLEQMKQKEQALGRKLTRAEFHVLYPSVHKAYFEDVENTKKISKIMAGIAAAFAGHNIVVGAATGAVAVDNNFGFAAAFGVSALADTAFAAYLVEGLTLVGGAYLITEALDFIGVQAVDGGYQYHDRFYGSVSDALAAVMLDNPITQAAGSIYLVAKTLLDVVIDAPNHLTDLDLTRSASYDNSHQQKQTGDHQPQRQQPQQSSSASTGGSMPPPEDPDDEGKFKKNKLTEKQREQLKGKTLEGENPGNIAPGNRGFTNVDTEKLGGLEEAKKTFERLTGEKVPGHLNKQGDMHYKILPNGNRIQIRFEGDSGHPKIDITDQVQKILEKVSFK